MCECEREKDSFLPRIHIYRCIYILLPFVHNSNTYICVVDYCDRDVMMSTNNHKH